MALYPAQLSLYISAASLCAGELTFGSVSSDYGMRDSKNLDRRQYRADVVHRAPFTLEDVQTDPSVCVYVRVEHLREELDLGCLVGIIRREVHRQQILA